MMKVVLSMICIVLLSRYTNCKAAGPFTNAATDKWLDEYLKYLNTLIRATGKVTVPADGVKIALNKTTIGEKVTYAYATVTNGEGKNLSTIYRKGPAQYIVDYNNQTLLLHFALKEFEIGYDYKVVDLAGQEVISGRLYGKLVNQTMYVSVSLIYFEKPERCSVVLGDARALPIDPDDVSVIITDVPKKYNHIAEDMADVFANYFSYDINGKIADHIRSSFPVLNRIADVCSYLIPPIR